MYMNCPKCGKTCGDGQDVCNACQRKAFERPLPCPFCGVSGRMGPDAAYYFQHAEDCWLGAQSGSLLNCVSQPEIVDWNKRAAVPIDLDDSEPITFAWVATHFPSKGAQYSARRHPKCPTLEWLNRFERFVLYDEPQVHLKTRGDVRRLVKALGYDLELSSYVNPNATKHDWLEI